MRGLPRQSTQSSGTTMQPRRCRQRRPCWPRPAGCRPRVLPGNSPPPRRALSPARFPPAGVQHSTISARPSGATICASSRARRFSLHTSARCARKARRTRRRTCRSIRWRSSGARCRRHRCARCRTRSRLACAPATNRRCSACCVRRTARRMRRSMRSTPCSTRSPTNRLTTTGVLRPRACARFARARRRN